MGYLRSVRFGAALLAALAGACETADKGPVENVVGEAGVDRFGEPCRTVAVRTGGVREATSTFEIRCGASARPSARIVVTAAPEPPADLVRAGDWRDRLDAAAVCREPVEGVLFDGVPITRLDCVWRTSGQPLTAFAARIGAETYLVDTIPSADTAVARALAERAGLEPQTGVALSAGEPASYYRIDDLATVEGLLREAESDHRRGDFAAAEERYRQALGISERLATNHSQTAFLSMSLGLMLSNQGKFDQAEAQFDRAAAEIRMAAETVEFGFELEDQETRLRSAVATHLVNQNNRRFDRDAAVLGQEAASRWESEAELLGVNVAAGPARASDFTTGTRGTAAAQSVPVVVANVDLIANETLQGRIAAVGALLGQNRLAEARRELDAAAASLGSLPVSEQNFGPQVEFLFGVVAHRQGKQQEAAARYGSAAARQQQIEDSSRMEGLALLFQGLALQELGRTDAALIAYRRAVDVFRKSGGGIPPDYLYPYFQAVLEKSATQSSQRQALVDEAFEAAQMVTGSETAKIVAASAVQLSATDTAVGRRLKDLETARRQLNSVTRELDLARGPAAVATREQIAALVKQRDTLRAEIAAAEREAQAEFPQYNQIRTTPFDAASVRQALAEDEGLVNIILSDRGSVGLFVDRNGIKLYEIPLTSRQIQGIVNDLRFAVEEPDPNNPNDIRTQSVPNFDVGKAFQLYSALFSPVESQLRGKRHVIIVPNGALLSLPPQVLVTNANRNTGPDYRNVAWLAREHALTVSPSVQSIMLLRRLSSGDDRPNPYVGFGDFVPSGDSGRLLQDLNLTPACLPEAQAIANANRLPATANEVKQAAQLLGAGDSAAITGSDFTKTRVEDVLKNRYAVVHFATHGLLSGRFQCLPEPALTLTADSSNNGLLMASEISTLDMKGAILILSACDTGGPGGRGGGESLSGLAQAFYLARARSLLVTHWPVLDKVAAEIVTSTLRQLATGNTTLAEALALAQRRYLDSADVSHPLFWAAFAVVGDGQQRLTRGAAGAAAGNSRPEPWLAAQ